MIAAGAVATRDSGVDPPADRQEIRWRLLQSEVGALLAYLKTV
jgi:hypothetical protein